MKSRDDLVDKVVLYATNQKADKRETKEKKKKKQQINKEQDKSTD